MKKKMIYGVFSVFLLVVMIGTFTSAKRAPQTVHILMLGNSHTHRNNVPDILEQLCQDTGIHAEVSSITLSGIEAYKYIYPRNEKQKEKHEQVMDLLKNYKWDFVVVQGARNESITAPKKMQKAVKHFKKLTRKAGGKLILYMPWERKETDEDTEATTKRLAEDYYRMAERFHCEVAPSGIAMANAKTKYPDMELYHRDEAHASLAGSYLSACTIFETMFPGKLRGCSYYGRVPEDIAVRLQKIASRTVKGK